MISLVTAATLAALCGTAPLPVEPVDASESATYTDVGDEARAKQDLTIAVTAYRKAIALDSSNRRAQGALRAICEQPANDDGGADLLEAITLFRLGDRDGAHAIVGRLAARGELPSGAHFLLGMMALEEHDRRTAERELQLAGRDPAYAKIASDLQRQARRDGTVAAMVLAAPEIDTNPQQLPDTPPMGATTGRREADADLLVASALTFRPALWLAIRNVLAWRKQRELAELDFLGENAQATLETGRGPTRGYVRYDIDYDVVGGESYLLAHRGSGGIRHDLGAVELGTSGSIRRRDYLQRAQDEFTGWVYAGDIGAVVHLGTRADLDVKAIGWRELTAEPIFSAIAAGGQVALRARPASRLRVALQSAVWYAHYDAAGPDGVQRRDVHVEGTADVELDLADHVILVAGASATRNGSTIDDFRYWKLVARCGLAFAIGGL